MLFNDIDLEIKILGRYRNVVCFVFNKCKMTKIAHNWLFRFFVKYDNDTLKLRIKFIGFIILDVCVPSQFCFQLLLKIIFKTVYTINWKCTL